MTSPARRDTDHVGVDVALRAGDTAVPVVLAFEYALVVTNGAVTVEGHTVTPGQLLYLGVGRDELGLRSAEPSRALLLGGLPFGEQLLMRWNFVARTRDEVDAAYDDWMGDSGRFGRVPSRLPVSRRADRRGDRPPRDHPHPSWQRRRPMRYSSSAGPASTCRPSALHDYRDSGPGSPGLVAARRPEPTFASH